MFDELIQLFEKFLKRGRTKEQNKTTIWSLSKLITTQSEMLMQSEVPDDDWTRLKLVQAQGLAFALAGVLMELNEGCEQDDLFADIQSYLAQIDDAEAGEQ